MGVGVGDFNVIPEDTIEADFEAVDAGSRDLGRLKVGDPFLASLGDGVQLIERGVVTGADHSAFARREGRIVHHGGVEALAQVGAQLQACFQIAKQIGPASGDLGLDAWQEPQRAGDISQIAGGGSSRACPGRKALQVETLPESVAQVGTERMIFE